MTVSVFAFIWERLKGSFWGRLAAAVVIVGLVCFITALKDGGKSFDRETALPIIIVMGSMGILAVLLLEFGDYRKRKKAMRQNRINMETECPFTVMENRAHNSEEPRQPLFMRIGVGIGLLSILCGIIMGIIKVVEFIRGVL